MKLRSLLPTLLSALLVSSIAFGQSLTASGGGGGSGGGGISSLTANSTPTTSYTNGQLVYSDGTKIQAVGPGTTTTLLHGNAAGAPTYGPVDLSTEVTGALSVALNAQTGTSYTIVSGDKGKLITFTSASPVAVTVPQATGTFGAQWSTTVQCVGPSTCTFTPTSGTINGAANILLLAGEGVTLVSDGTNWSVSGTWDGGGAGVATITVNSTNTAGGAAGQVWYDDGTKMQQSANFVYDSTNKALYFSTQSAYQVGYFGGANNGIGFSVSNKPSLVLNWAGLGLIGNNYFGWSSNTSDATAAPDVRLSRTAAGVLLLDGGAGTGAAITTQATTVGSLPAAATAGVGARAFVTDASACTFMGAITGGGSTKCPVHSDGSSWLGG